ncbi:hypothetical protein CFB46_11600 [Burkholderia sp. HI2761]|nr:hypothetical protein [Burkholderia sp. BE24]OXJ28146.1 hypothetical protein CFB46_11600 [Burkholderia sp. HI2761]
MARAPPGRRCASRFPHLHIELEELVQIPRLPAPPAFFYLNENDRLNQIIKSPVRGRATGMGGGTWQ